MIEIKKRINKIQVEGEYMKRKFLSTIVIFLLGLILGIASRLFDIYCQVLGEVFSRMSIWILLGAIIAIYSPTKIKAMLNIFFFCIGMLFTYYLMAIITHGVYSTDYIIGWLIFSCFTPIMAYFVRLSKQDGIIAKIIRISIILFTILSEIILFGQLEFYDIIIDIFLIYFIFFKEIHYGNKEKYE